MNFVSLYCFNLFTYSLTSDIMSLAVMLLIWAALIWREVRFFWAFTTPKKDVDVQEKIIKEIVEKSAQGDDATAKPLMPEKGFETPQAVEARLERLQDKLDDKRELALKKEVIDVLPSGEPKEIKPPPVVNFLLVNQNGIAERPDNAPAVEATGEVRVWQGDELMVENAAAKNIKFNDKQADSVLKMLEQDARNKEEYRKKRTGIRNYFGKNRLFNWTNLILLAAGIVVSFVFNRLFLPGTYMAAMLATFLAVPFICMAVHYIKGRIR